VTYTYDNIGQLKSAIGSGGQSTENLGYLYDTAWNLNKRTNNGTPTTFAVDVKNQLTSVGSTSYTYDYNGNVSTAGALYYSYDDENQLTQVMLWNTWKNEFTYDGRGRLRVRKDSTWSGSSWTLASETHYVYDGMRVIEERNGISGGNTPTVAYTRGNDLSGSLEGAGGIGGLLARSHGYSRGTFSTHSFYHADGNGNVTYLVNSSQAMVANYRYDPYGNTRYSGGTLASANTYRFSSKEQMPNSGLYYYGYRFYDPNLQRWPNRDPLGELGGVNLYTMVRNNAIGAYDPYGQTPVTSAMKCAAATALAYAACQTANPWACAGAIAMMVANCADALTECAPYFPDWMKVQGGPVWTPPSRVNAPPAVIVDPRPSPPPPPPPPPVYIPPTIGPPRPGDRIPQPSPQPPPPTSPPPPYYHPPLPRH